MSDLRLITILPPPPVQGIQQPSITGSQSQQTEISNLQAGSILSGFIINRDAGGNPILRSDSGDIAFASNFFLKIGSEITIRIEHIAGNNLAHILSVNGQPPEVAVLQSSFAQEPEIIVSENLRPASQLTSLSLPSPTITVTGTIISPAPTPPDSQNNLPQNLPHSLPDKSINNPASPLPQGSQLSLKIISISAPPTASIPTALPIETVVTDIPVTDIPVSNIPGSKNTPIQNISDAGSATAPAGLYTAYARTNLQTPAVNIPAIQPEILPPATAPQATIQPDKTAPATNIPVTENAKAPPPQAGQQINAQVISNNPGGEAIIQTPIGIMRLQAGIQLPIGSQVTFEIEQVQPTGILKNIADAITATNIASPPAPLAQLARSPGTLSNIFILLSGLNSSDALNFVNKTIPTAGQGATSANIPAAQLNQNIPASPNIPMALLMFTAALRSGDFRAWLGRSNAKWLEDNGHENLLKKAESEFLSISRQFIDTPEKQWQSLFFPIAVAGELQQARLFVKRERKEKNGKGGSEEDTRFVLEVNLSQLGEMQMDGFVRRNNDNIQFDLMIRSHTHLSQEIQKGILDIYNNTGELTGYQGSIIFQAIKDFPVNPMEDIIAGNHEEIIA